ncbi:unnamed protein product, partial [Mesorhabditis spiculigera]
MLIWPAIFTLLLKCTTAKILFEILTQPDEYELANRLKESLERDEQNRVEFSHETGKWGHWTLFQSISRLSKSVSEHSANWLVIVEPYSLVDQQKLCEFLGNEDSTKAMIFGYALRDEGPTIIHHYHHTPTGPQLPYPDFGAGLAISAALLKRLADELQQNPYADNFAIDAKHEFAKYLKERLGIEMEHRPHDFCLFPTDGCAVSFNAPKYSQEKALDAKDIYAAVKTYSEYHRTRVVAVKRTWGIRLPFIDYFSDAEDAFVPTKTLGIPNTKRGHCAKTLAILRYYAKNVESYPNNKWLLIADDDTLLSTPRLLRLLGERDHMKKMIIGERYGFSYSADGSGGYDYPTGGSGMIFSKPAALQLAGNCECPSDDSPDDMIIGVCARSFNIPIIHSSSFHQARSTDYAKDYIARQPPISFHKFEDLSPYDEYTKYLHEETGPTSTVHSEL